MTGKCKKGIGADFLEHILRKVARDAWRILGRGAIAIWMDKAPGHQAKKTVALLNELLGEVIIQPGKSGTRTLQCSTRVTSLG